MKIPRDLLDRPTADIRGDDRADPVRHHAGDGIGCAEAIAFAQRRCEDLLNISEERWPIHRAVNDIRRGEAIDAQRGNERQRLPVAVWHARDETLFADKDKSYREAYRVLTSGGRYHFNVWDSFEFNLFARISHETVCRFFKQDAPTFFEVPFAYHRIDAIKASLIRAGFEDLSVHVLKIDKTIRQVRRLAQGLILGNRIIEEIRERGTANPDAMVVAMTAALHRAFGPDPGRMSLQALVFSALRP